MWRQAGDARRRYRHVLAWRWPLRRQRGDEGRATDHVSAAIASVVAWQAPCTPLASVRPDGRPAGAPWSVASGPAVEQRAQGRVERRGTTRTPRRSARGRPGRAPGDAPRTSSPPRPPRATRTAPTPTAARIAAPRTAVSPTVGIATGTPRTSALIRAQASPGRRPAGQPQLANRGAGRRQRLRDVAQRERRPLERRASEVLRPVGQRQPEEHAARLLVEDRRALPRQVRQEHEPVGAGRDPPRPRGTARPASSGRPAPRSAPSPRTRPAPPSPRPRPTARAAAPAPGTPARHLDRAVRVDPDPAGRAARVHRVARQRAALRPASRPSRR